jgi:hypothetical protein
VPDFMDRIVSAVAEVKDDASDAAAGSEEVSGEGAFWKHKFEELQALRVTAPEQRLANLKVKMDAQEKAMNKLASSVRGMLKRTRSRAVQQPQQQSSSSAAAAAAAAADDDDEAAVDEDTDGGSALEMEMLEAKLEQKREMVRFYQKLTGVVVEPVQAEDEDDDDELETMACTAINHIHKRAVKFDLQLSGEDNNALFVPTANTGLLPTTLRVRPWWMFVCPARSPFPFCNAPNHIRNPSRTGHGTVRDYKCRRSSEICDHQLAAAAYVPAEGPEAALRVNIMEEFGDECERRLKENVVGAREASAS